MNHSGPSRAVRVKAIMGAAMACNLHAIEVSRYGAFFIKVVQVSPRYFLGVNISKEGAVTVDSTLNEPEAVEAFFEELREIMPPDCFRFPRSPDKLEQSPERP